MIGLLEINAGELETGVTRFIAVSVKVNARVRGKQSGGLHEMSVDSVVTRY